MTIRFMKQLLILIAVTGLLGGCLSPNRNPPQARAGTGYIDLYTIADDGLNWEVARFNAQSLKYEVIFSELKPLPVGVLRLVFPPGRYQLRVTFLNCAIREPAVFEVEVAATMVTPVHVVLTEDGITQVQGRAANASSNLKGGGRKAGSYMDEASIYRIATVVNAPLPYRLKEQMPYAH